MEKGIDLAQEKRFLDEILRVVRAELDAARADQAEQESDMLLLQDDFPEEPDQAFTSVGSVESFEDLATLTQYIQPLSDQQHRQEGTRARIAALEQMAASPYFARLDLCFDGDEEASSFYIGRATIWQGQEILVHDWRSPLAGLFYRFGAGPAFYDAPAGPVHCRLLRKRQYEIRGGELLYCFDADTPIQDAFLRRMLSQGATPQMRSIVETIQRDQDAVIRDEKNELLLVQGAAGSGKTAIALHRVAYLMYEGLKNRLQAHHMLIVSPNRLFERYIGGVLPELSGRSVSTATLEQLLEERLARPVQTRGERLDWLYTAPPEKRALRRQAIAFFSSRTFLSVLDRFIVALPRVGIPYRDLYYAGAVVATRQEIRTDVLRRGDILPLGLWLRRYEATLWQRVHALRPRRMETLRIRAQKRGHGEALARGYSIYESGALAREIRAMTRPDALSLYHTLSGHPRLLRSLAAGLPMPENLEALLFSVREGLSEGVLSLEEASAAAYIQLRLYGAPRHGEIRQAVVDEAQDYGAVDFAVLGALFPSARFTVLGDIYQSLERAADLSLYEDIRSVLARRSAVFAQLTRSFRCTREILHFSARLLPGMQIESFNRPGDAPRILPAARIVQEAEACRRDGLRSLALIVRTRQDAQSWLARLRPVMPIRLMGQDGASGEALLLPLALSKGLEFDAVFVLDCDAAHYADEADAHALYVACTRALHRLCLFCDGVPSPLLNREEVISHA